MAKRTAAEEREWQEKRNRAREMFSAGKTVPEIRTKLGEKDSRVRYWIEDLKAGSTKSNEGASVNGTTTTVPAGLLWALGLVQHGADKEVAVALSKEWERS